MKKFGMFIEVVSFLLMVFGLGYSLYISITLRSEYKILELIVLFIICVVISILIYFIGCFINLLTNCILIVIQNNSEEIEKRNKKVVRKKKKDKNEIKAIEGIVENVKSELVKNV